MSQKEYDLPKERGLCLYNTSHSALRMINERLILENAGLRLSKLPLCMEEDAASIEEIIPRAKEGFSLSIKSNSMTPSEMTDLLLPSTPLTIQGIWGEIKLKERHNTLPEWQYFMATLGYLTRIGRVSFFDFPDLPNNLQQFGEAETFWWDDCYTPGKIWEKMEELEYITREALYSPNSMGNEKLLKIAHFFSAGREISKIFLNL